MTLTIIIISCLLLLIAYAFEVFSNRIKSPSVILMLLLGWLAQQAVSYFNFYVPDLNVVLPVFGTVGLILIVMEGAMELEISREKMPLIRRSSVMALVPLLLLAFALGWAFFQNEPGSFKNSLTNAIPFCIISSAIAIPSVSILPGQQREFVIFESSLSDIIGVMAFNFVALNSEITGKSIEIFIAQIVIIIGVTLVSTVGIAFMLTRIRYHVRFIPILLVIILVYTLAKTMHQPGLVFVLLCGILLGNIRHVPLTRRMIRSIKPGEISASLGEFKKITVEFTFIIRVIFFVTFGFLIRTEEVLNTATLPWAAGIIAGILVIRGIFLKLLRVPLFPLIFVAPRGLITILLFYLIPAGSGIGLVNRSLIVQVILLSVAILMLGLMLNKPKKTNADPGHA